MSLTAINMQGIELMPGDHISLEVQPLRRWGRSCRLTNPEEVHPVFVAGTVGQITFSPADIGNGIVWAAEVFVEIPIIGSDQFWSTSARITATTPIQKF